MAKLVGLSDPAALAALGERLAHQRLQRNLTQEQLAREAGISKRTLIRLEQGESSQLTNLIRLLRALGLLDRLDAFIPPPVPSPLEQLKQRTKVRRRASPGSKGDRPTTTWRWGDESPQAGDEA
jgi:putative transcriptional regulator